MAAPPTLLSPPRAAARTLQAIARVLRDSNQTTEIHVVEELTGQGVFGRLAREMRATGGDPEGLLDARPELSSEHVDYAALRELPANTLGAAYVRHLDDHGLSADLQASSTRFVEEGDVAYLMRRFRQTHDVWHALTGLGVEPWQEVVIHAFALGQVRTPVSWLVVTLGGVKHGVLERRLRMLKSIMPKAYALGRRARPLMGVFWERQWQVPLDEVRLRYAIEPVPQ